MEKKFIRTFSHPRHITFRGKNLRAQIQNHGSTFTAMSFYHHTSRVHPHLSLTLSTLVFCHCKKLAVAVTKGQYFTRHTALRCGFQAMLVTLIRVTPTHTNTSLNCDGIGPKRVWQDVFPRATGMAMCRSRWGVCGCQADVIQWWNEPIYMYTPVPVLNLAFIQRLTLTHDCAGVYSNTVYQA